MLRWASLLLCVLACVGVGCGEGSSSDSGCGAGKACAGVCSARGWRDTCEFHLSCSGGTFELACTANYYKTKELLDSKGIDLGGKQCACIVDQSEVTLIDRDDSFCLDKFADTDADRHDKAAAIAANLCGWSLKTP